MNRNFSFARFISLQYRHLLFIPYLIFGPISMILNLIALAKSVPEVPIYIAVPLGMLTSKFFQDSNEVPVPPKRRH